MILLPYTARKDSIHCALNDVAKQLLNDPECMSDMEQGALMRLLKASTGEDTLIRITIDPVDLVIVSYWMEARVPKDQEGRWLELRKNVIDRRIGQMKDIRTEFREKQENAENVVRAAEAESDRLALSTRVHQERRGEGPGGMVYVSDPE